MRINENKASQQGESRKELRNQKGQFAAGKRRPESHPKSLGSKTSLQTA